jgi:excisionase family DNA binding protein
VSLSKVKVERLDQTGRRDAEALARQLSKITRTRSADLKIQGVMLKLLRELTELVSKHPGIAMVPIDRELSPADAGEILGISRPTVVRLMQAGELPFRLEGKHHRCKLEDVLRLKAAGERRLSATGRCLNGGGRARSRHHERAVQEVHNRHRTYQKSRFRKERAMDGPRRNLLHRCEAGTDFEVRRNARYLAARPCIHL